MYELNNNEMIGKNYDHLFRFIIVGDTGNKQLIQLSENHAYCFNLQIKNFERIMN